MPDRHASQKHHKGTCSGAEAGHRNVKIKAFTCVWVQQWMPIEVGEPSVMVHADLRQLFSLHSNPTGQTWALHRVRRKISPYHVTFSSLQLYGGYSTGYVACLCQRRVMIASCDSYWKSDFIVRRKQQQVMRIVLEFIKERYLVLELKSTELRYQG